MGGAEDQAAESTVMSPRLQGKVKVCWCGEDGAAEWIGTEGSITVGLTQSSIQFPIADTKQ